MMIDGGVTSGGAVVRGDQLPEPVPHPPVAPRVVGHARAEDDDDHQDRHHRAHCSRLRDGDGSRLLHVDRDN